MNFSSPLFIILIITGPVFVITGYLLFKFPPKKINGFYGYRTANSMKSIESWNFAQQFSAKEMINSGRLLTIMSLSGLFIDLNEGIEVVIGLIALIIFAIIPLIRTEKELKKMYGKKIE